MKIYCEECNKHSNISSERTECFDLCDNCYSALKERCIKMNDRDYRMQIARAALAYANTVNNTKEGKMRAFFAAVMPEIPQYRVNKIVRNIKQ